MPRDPASWRWSLEVPVIVGSPMWRLLPKFIPYWFVELDSTILSWFAKWPPSDPVVDIRLAPFIEALNICGGCDNCWPVLNVRVEFVSPPCVLNVNWSCSLDSVLNPVDKLSGCRTVNMFDVELSLNADCCCCCDGLCDCGWLSIEYTADCSFLFESKWMFGLKWTWSKNKHLK